MAALLLTAGANAAVFTTDTIISEGDTNYDGDTIIISGCTVWINGQHTFSDLFVVTDGILTHSNGGPGMTLMLDGDLEIEPGSAINVSGQGYMGGGPGAGTSSGNPLAGSGGGYGGYGGSCLSNGPSGMSYGSPFEPNSPGSSGGNSYAGPGGAGGGLVHITLGGTAILNGTISANGSNATNSRSGGGSGGSIWLSAYAITGNGSLSANGGAGEPIYGGGGGGGRIALQFVTNTFSGGITAHGGDGWQRGGAGTIFLQTNSSPGRVTFDNGGIAGAGTLLQFTNPAAVFIQGGASAVVSSTTQTVGDFVVRSNSFVTTLSSNNASLLLTIQGDATVDAGASILVDGRGSPQNAGPGVGQSINAVAGGSAHGGNGGAGRYSGVGFAPGGGAYGNILGPTTFGSGGRSAGIGSGGAGGGAVRLSISGNLLLNGRISAEATDGTAGGGGASGGSIWITVSNGFSGMGSISADGGNGGDNGSLGAVGGGGGGGRILMTCTSNSFTGAFSAHGGTGSIPGGAGTIVMQRGIFTDLLADNAGLIGTNTPVNSGPLVNVTVSGGASVLFSGSIAGINVQSNSSLTFPQQFTATLSNLTIAAAGIVSSDSVILGGSGSGQASYPAGSGGGGHGGYGGGGAGIPALGGNAYDNAASPQNPGSMGGPSPNGTGGLGGGALHFTVNGPTLIDGRLSANGGSGTNGYAGGGSGGSLWLNCNGSFSGSGLISADGGSGYLPGGGGGGGGRIAVYYSSNSFTGAFSTRGGAGFAGGGAGTVYLKQSNLSTGNLIVDNGGLTGTNTVFDPSVGAANVTVTGGAILNNPSSSMSLNNLTIASNSTYQFNPLSGTLTVLSNATVLAGGKISADGQNISSSQGAGLLSAQGSGGGGHGGYGGNGAGSGGGGGTAFDSAPNPTLPGGWGGGINGQFVAGGGVINLHINGTLTLQGTISANGNSASTNAAGGGAGGSIFLSTSRMSGNGVLSANGGSGYPSNGGGGGGGRIALISSSTGYSFAGAISARGGVGFVGGGAGTIYLSLGQIPTLIIDNGGLTGTNTVLDSSVPNVTVSGGAILNYISTATLNNLTVASNAVFKFNSLAVAQLQINSNLTVLAGGRISADGLNVSSSSVGSGQGSSVGAGGGSHAGYGGNGAAPDASGWGGAPISDSPTTPSSPGGWGGQGFPNPLKAGGGGIMQITVIGLLTVDGTISANGFNAVTNIGGGGAGGSISLRVGGLVGNGFITADGGSGFSNGGGGGGGRIAIYHTGRTPGGFTGSISAKGGNGFVPGGAGTVYLGGPGFSPPTAVVANIIVDNGNLRGTNTLINPSGDLYDLTIQNGARGLMGNSVGQLRNLIIHTNSSLVQSGSVALTISMSGNATIDEGGAIVLDALGALGNGQGSAALPRGGGSYGGYGAFASGGGIAYGTTFAPTMPGSQGGPVGFGSGTYGGLGGGAMHLITPGTLTLNGKVSANGGSGGYLCGGGSGGSIWLSVGSFVGKGQISASGGDGDGAAGGGGGGRIAINYSGSNTFSGSISACGGLGGGIGGAGTIYVQHGQTPGSLTLNNCGLAGTNTPLAAQFGLAPYVNVSGGAIAEYQNQNPQFTFSNITVTGSSAITAPTPVQIDVSYLPIYLKVNGDVFVDSTSLITADGKGSTAISGQGSGRTVANQGSGGGYGGAGGMSASGASGGVIYGLPAYPLSLGSGGGWGNQQMSVPESSSGGGLVRLYVAGTLDVEGNVSASGYPGLQDDSGGGSGGSIWLTASHITGGGTIRADGGDGDLFGGGGGGGGRIAIYSPANTFTGLVSVAVGDGAFAGQTGTVFTSSSLAAPFAVLSSSPTNSISNVVSAVNVTFTDTPLGVAASNFKVYSPAGLIDSTSISLTDVAKVSMGFSLQNTPGLYRIEVGPGISDYFGNVMSGVYTGYFTLSLPMISGIVTDTNSQPVAGVTVQPSGLVPSSTTDSSGVYSLGVPSGWTGTVKPSLGSAIFGPGSRPYTNVTANLAGQDYQIIPALAASIQFSRSNTNILCGWQGYSGVTYQVYFSTNLFNWYPLGDPIPGTNGPMQYCFPVDDQPQEFFRVGSKN